MWVIKLSIWQIINLRGRKEHHLEMYSGKTSIHGALSRWCLEGIDLELPPPGNRTILANTCITSCSPALGRKNGQVQMALYFMVHLGWKTQCATLHPGDDWYPKPLDTVTYASIYHEFYQIPGGSPDFWTINASVVWYFTPVHLTYLTPVVIGSIWKCIHLMLSNPVKQSLLSVQRSIYSSLWTNQEPPYLWMGWINGLCNCVSWWKPNKFLGNKRVGSVRLTDRKNGVAFFDTKFSGC